MPAAATRMSRYSLFPAWSDTVLRLALTAFVVGGVMGVPAVLMAWVRSPLYTDVGHAVVQPVAFDHRHHTRDDGIDCRYCHADAHRSPAAGVPGAGVCMGCHAQVWKDEPELAPVRASALSGQPIAWDRVHDLPDFVYFDHSIHVSRGVGCETCHGRVDQMASVYKTETLQMGWCLECHRAPEVYLRPPAEVTTMGYVPPIDQATLGAKLRDALHVDPPTHCSGCHR